MRRTVEPVVQPRFAAALAWGRAVGRLVAASLMLCSGVGLLAATEGAAADQPRLPPFEDVQQCVEDYFQKDRDRRKEDLVTRGQVAEVLKQLQQLGWKVPQQQQLIEKVLDDQHVLVRTFRTPAGRRFLSKVADRELIYDRLDRISEVSGGPELIRDVVKLPDGERYAKPQSGGGVPDLLDLLPKNASGRTRRIADYDRPTGHLYTVSDLVAYLAECYQNEKPGPAPSN
jgi:hypothetical protein